MLIIITMLMARGAVQRCRRAFSMLSMLRHAFSAQAGSALIIIFVDATLCAAIARY